MQRRDVVILGSTGSIGTQALDLVRANPDRIRVVGLTAGGSNPDLFAQQVEEFAPAVHGLGEEASVDVAAHPCDVVLNGITGAVGLRPTLAALDAGSTLALANKETLVCAGALVLETARQHRAQLLPVDSEHSAVFQALIGEDMAAPPPLPPVFGVLVNPGVPLSTAAVFGELGGVFSEADRFSAAPADANALVALLAARSNDLEAPARRLCPALDLALAKRRECIDSIRR